MKIFIPIKHVSQRVPHKNFRLIDGEPLYKKTLKKFSNHEIFVDTDSDQIIEELKKDKLENVTVFKRKGSLRGNEISVCELIKNFIYQFSIKEPIAQIHVTSPFLTADLLESAYRKIKNYDSVVSCNVIRSRIWRKEKYGFCPVNHNPLKMEQTQDLPKYYEENSAFYIFKPNIIKSYGNRIGKNPFFYEINEPYNIDIDTEEDWTRALREIKNERNN